MKTLKLVLSLITDTNIEIYYVITQTNVDT